ncbi:urocanate hydratase [Helicobacter sp. 11S03491-1]|uniref:urocanate hydratase n=1 Tax=Helicobacter sp. 11S03491-1 TaxID=1476196 RepID=UPI000BA51A4D|nr:urocanate hydratase [Helicobacter sp. 11S03491-1]PAF43427.1 urocanate hydratase [Helicobacter sp. 11S03491-1]
MKIQIASGDKLRTKNWRTEGLLRMLENVLYVGEDPQNLIVYAALGKAARDMKSYEKIVETLKNLEIGYTLIVQSGKPIGVLKTHSKAPVVLMANCNMVGQWANADYFYELNKKGLICWGGLTAGDWQYIGSQGVIQGTYEIFCQIARKHFNHSLEGRFILTAGLGGMGGAQGLAGFMAGGATLIVEVDEERIDKRLKNGYLQKKAKTLDQALSLIQDAIKKKEALSVGLLGNAAQIYPQILQRGILPDIVTDQTSAHDLVYGYIPVGFTPEEIKELREKNPKKLMEASLASIKIHLEAMLGFQKRGSIVFDNGNLIRTQAKNAGVQEAFNIPVFTEAFLRDLFCQAIGPFRWVSLCNNKEDIAKIDAFILKHFEHNKIVSNWIKLASKYIPFEGLPARIAWLGHGERTQLALGVNEMVANKDLSGPIAFTRDHLDAGAMAHPNIMTENMLDGSDGIADWPLLNAMLNCSSEADLVAIHSGGGGYSGYMTSAGVTLIADGSKEAAERLSLSLNNDTALGVMRYADAGYEIALREAKSKNIGYFDLRNSKE